MYTPYADLLTLVTVVAKLPTAGGLYLWHTIQSFRLHRHFDTLQIFSFVINLCLMVFTIVFMVYVFHRVVVLGNVFSSASGIGLTSVLSHPPSFSLFLT